MLWYRVSLAVASAYCSTCSKATALIQMPTAALSGCKQWPVEQPCCMPMPKSSKNKVVALTVCVNNPHTQDSPGNHSKCRDTSCHSRQALRQALEALQLPAVNVLWAALTSSHPGTYLQCSTAILHRRCASWCRPDACAPPPKLCNYLLSISKLHRV